TAAVKDCVTCSQVVELVGLGDLFPDHLAKCREDRASLATVDDRHAFTGFDAYQKVLESKIDLVLLATPPAFRARHLAAAIDAGKHVFMEKPIAVDATGVRSVMAKIGRAHV